jgi:LacI family transcriptional regulator
MNGKKRVSIGQVAQEAGVSIQTVSRVTNNHPDVAAETRKRVLEVVERLGYQPSRIARAMRGHSRTIGVIGYGLEYFGPSRTISGLELRINELGFTFILSLVRNAEIIKPERILNEMISRNIDGIIWTIPDIGDNMRQITNILPALPVPIIFTDSEHLPSTFIVENDNVKGGKMAVEHLILQGYYTIGLITGPLHWRSARLRKQAWFKVLESKGLENSSSLVVESDWTAAGGAQGLERLLEQRPDMDAVFASNDQMALGAIQTVRKKGLRVPDDLAIIGYDDIPEASFFCPPLSSIRQPLYEIGRLAVDELVKLIEAMREEKEVEPKAITIKPELVVRESTAARQPALTDRR